MYCVAVHTPSYSRVHAAAALHGEHLAVVVACVVVAVRAEGRGAGALVHGAPGEVWVSEVKAKVHGLEALSTSMYC